MKCVIALSACVLAACSPVESSPVGDNLASKLDLSPSADFKSVVWEDESYFRTQAKSYPLIDSWIYTRIGETPEHFSKRVEVQRYKKVDAPEIFRQMQEATGNRAKDSDMASRTICYEHDPQGLPLHEASIWRYADVTNTKGEVMTYATGVMYRFADMTAYDTFMRSEFMTACRGMRSQTVIAPPALSKS